MPDVLDDPQFLPIITVAGTEKAELFYHYRQYTLSTDSPMALLFYPVVSTEKRAVSFKLLNSLVGGISCGIKNILDILFEIAGVGSRELRLVRTNKDIV